MFAYYYGVKPEGNVKSDPAGEFVGKNILHRVRTMEETAKRFDRTEDEVGQALLQARKTLFEARKRRPRPHLDDKILVEWNGLMISALAAAYRVFGDSRYLIAADAAIAFIRERMVVQEKCPICSAAGGTGSEASLPWPKIMRSSSRGCLTRTRPDLPRRI